MNALERYLTLMGKCDTDPRHWHALWLNDVSERLVYVEEPLVKVSEELVRAVIQLDTEALMAFLVGLDERVASVEIDYPEYRVGSEAKALREMVNLSMFAAIKQSIPAIVVAGLVTALLDDLDEATTAYCANCETRLERITLMALPTEGVLVDLVKTVTFLTEHVLLCSVCDRDDERWFQDTRSMGKDVRLWIRDELRWALGDGAGV